MKKIILLLSFLLAINVWATSTRTLDGQQITNGAALLTLPTTTDTLLGRDTTDTLTNKSLNGGSNTFTNIPASAVSSGTLSVSNGGTGASSLTLNNVLLGNGTSAVQFVAPGTSGNVLTSNGTTWSSSALPATTPSLNGGSASPQSVSAAGGVSLASIGYVNFVWVVGNGGAVTVTATPSVTVCTADGQLLYIIGTDNTNTVTLQDAGTLSNSKLRLNGQWVGAKYSQLLLSCNFATTEWFEVSRR